MMILVLFLTAFGIQGVIWTLLAIGFNRAKSQFYSFDNNSPAETAVIVAVHNEEDNVDDLLNCLAMQTQANLEIIIVNDNSTDRTEKRIKESEHFERIVLVHNVESKGKKSALAAGISKTNRDRFLFTDADCRPSPLWTSKLSSLLSASADVVIGYSPFGRRAGLLNKISRYETFVTGFLTAAATGFGTAYMSVGRNFGYTRSAFNSVDGFSAIMHSLSGDDDLMVQRFQRRRLRIVHAFGADTYVVSELPRTWKEWTTQKMRHTSASRYYPLPVSLIIFLFQTTGIAMYAAPFFLGYSGASLLLATIVIQWLSLRSAADEFDEGDLKISQPLLHACYALYNLFIAPIGVMMKPKKW